jgi:CubicO group peptidase (beta-lactamase class C family)
MDALQLIDGWGSPEAAAAVVGGSGMLAARGDRDAVSAWASVTKLVTAYLVLVDGEAGTISLDDPAGPPGSTVRHLLAHASGLATEGEQPVSRPERTRIYSNQGFDRLGEIVAQRESRPFRVALRDRVLTPLGMASTELVGRPSDGLAGSLADLARFARELLRPALVSPATLDEATSVVFPGLAGVLPGVGRFESLDWGLGFELRDAKQPHWTGSTNSARTFGHFGRSGSFLWVDPVADVALVALARRDFGAWALDAWPALSDAVLASVSSDQHQEGRS